MNETDLPPLPEPAIKSALPLSTLSNVLAYGYHAEQMRAYALAAVAAERGRAIRACEGEMLEGPTNSDGDIAYGHAVSDCIDAIRKG